MCKECQGCTLRTIEPNCHNAKTCQAWARHEKKQAARRERESDDRILHGRQVRFRKGAGSRDKGQYIVGEVKPTVKKGHEIVKR